MEEPWYDEMYEADPPSFEADVERLIGVVTLVLRDGLEKHRDALMDSAAAVEEWSSEEHDPQRMGWVDGYGRP